MMKKLLLTSGLCCGLLLASTNAWADNSKLYQTLGEKTLLGTVEFGVVANGTEPNSPDFNGRWATGFNLGFSGKYVYDVSKHIYHYGSPDQYEAMAAHYLAYRLTLGAKHYGAVDNAPANSAYRLANLGIMGGVGIEFADNTEWSNGVAVYLGTRVGSDGRVPFAYQIVPYFKYKDVTFEFLNFNMELGSDKNKQTYIDYSLGFGAGVKF